jgi:hypothetical protein
VGLYRDAAGVARRDPDLKRARDPAETWASSRGYEALAAGAARDADAAVAAASKRPYENETGEHDDGARRVREALEAHVWPGLTMKTEKKLGSSSNVDTNVAAREDDDDRSVAGTKTKKSASGADADENGDGDGDGAADESMEHMESMESMLAEMARVRAAAAGASDEERRKAAAEVAKRMMRMFDLDGDASESGTESDS